MSYSNHREIYTISTAIQPAEPLPQDKILTLLPERGGGQFIERKRFVYRWARTNDRNLDSIILYRGTRPPRRSSISFFRTRAKKLVAVYEEGHEVEPPLIQESELPVSTIVTVRERLYPAPSTPPAPATVPVQPGRVPFFANNNANAVSSQHQSVFHFRNFPSSSSSSTTAPAPAPPCIQLNLADFMQATHDALHSRASRKRSRDVESDEGVVRGVVKRIRKTMGSRAVAFALGVAVGTYKQEAIREVWRGVVGA